MVDRPTRALMVTLLLNLTNVLCTLYNHEESKRCKKSLLLGVPSVNYRTCTREGNKLLLL